MRTCAYCSDRSNTVLRSSTAVAKAAEEMPEVVPAVVPEVAYEVVPGKRPMVDDGRRGACREPEAEALAGTEAEALAGAVAEAVAVAEAWRGKGVNIGAADKEGPRQVAAATKGEPCT